jgi:urease accessory protein
MTIAASFTLVHRCLVILLHGFGGGGFLHPLTGIDHMVAMVAVGAWSAQLGGTNVIRVPVAFLTMMCIGGLIGVAATPLPYVQFGVVVSVILLGLAIALNQRVAWILAVLGVGIFGLFHGYSHGREIPQQQHVALYIFGFLITTLGLHVVGAVSGLLLLEHSRGKVYLRRVGVVVFFVGIYLLR